MVINWRLGLCPDLIRSGPQHLKPIIGGEVVYLDEYFSGKSESGHRERCGVIYQTKLKDEVGIHWTDKLVCIPTVRQSTLAVPEDAASDKT